MATRQIHLLTTPSWYTLSVTHIPRPEEWPVMPTTNLGFRLIPAGFFDANPALDVPKQGRPLWPPSRGTQGA